MPRPKASEKDLERREVRRGEWSSFRTQYLLTQKRLAEVLGISRRTIQMIEGGKITPRANTLRKFLVLKSKYEDSSAVGWLDNENR